MTKSTSQNNPKETDNLKEKAFSFSNLDYSAQEKIKDLIENKKGENFVVKDGGLFDSLWLLIFPIIWYVALYFTAQDEKWYESSWWWVLGISVAVNLIVATSVRDVVRFFLSPIKKYTILTPIYLVQVALDRVNVKPLWQIINIQATHNYRNRIHSGTDIKIEFKDKIENIWIYSKTRAEEFMRVMRQNRITVFNKIKEKDAEFLVKNYYFADIQGTKEIKENTLFYKVALCTFLLSIGFLFFLYTVNSAQPPQKEAETQQVEIVESFDQPVVNLPINGAQTKYYNGMGVAPLKIVTKEGVYHHFIKIVDWNTDEVVKTIFIRAGQSIETKLPIGTYEIRYASGKTWYGENYFFGPETIGSKADKKFNFTETYEGYSGYTIELIMQHDGNLRTSKIPMSKF